MRLFASCEQLKRKMKTEIIELKDILIFIHEIDEPNEQLILEAKVSGTPVNWSVLLQKASTS